MWFEGPPRCGECGADMAINYGEWQCGETPNMCMTSAAALTEKQGEMVYQAWLRKNREE